MSEPQSYPVFFDCEALDDLEKKKIQNYFQIKRKSGGGDCSAIANVSDKVYRIDFKNLEAQQRVLEKREHLLEISGAPVVLIVRDKPEAAAAAPPPPITSPVSSPKPEPPASLLLRSISAASLPSGGEEHEVNLDSYLLQYLRDSHQAGSELDRELQSLQSSAKLCPEKEKVVVRSLVQFDDEAAKTWKTDVEKVFENITKQYPCHFETDAKSITFLLKSCSVCHDSDDVKVYSEPGMAVVVGESSQVDARLKHVADSHARGRGASLGRKQSSVWRLGEAKLRLLRQEIDRSMERDYPNLSVTQKDGGQLVLEGPFDEVCRANDMISEIEKKVQEKKVADMGARLLAFLFKAYNSPGKLSDFLGCRKSVEIELKMTELRLFSLSAKEIDQTIQEIKDKFKDMQIEVPNCNAVPAELHESLTNKIKSMNENGNKVQVAFTDNKVSLLGHATEVDELHEAVTEYILDQSNTSKPETRGRSNSGEKIIVLKGLSEDVLSVAELVNKAIKNALTEHLQEQQEEKLAETVEWFFQNQQKDWRKFSVHQNYILEEAHKKKLVSEDVETPNGTKIKVNLKSLVATDWNTGNTYRVRRCETDTGMELPKNWKSMAGEDFKRVEVDPSSKEYQDIALGFHKTAKYKIHKIERVQNFHLWRSYFLMRQKMLAKNGLLELGEKYLYHGTSAESCNCIERDRFDRSYTGAHGDWYGKGVYFAVKAEYSANKTYSKPDAKGLKRMYVARVLTGRYTLGTRGVVAPPPRGNDPSDKYDSLVDNQLNPTMFVIFHDDQAYPEYLITFS